MRSSTRRFVTTSCVGVALSVAGCGGSGSSSTTANPFTGFWWANNENSAPAGTYTVVINATGQIWGNPGPNLTVTGSITSGGTANIIYTYTAEPGIVIAPVTFQGLATIDGRGHLVGSGTACAAGGECGAYTLDWPRKY